MLYTLVYSGAYTAYMPGHEDSCYNNTFIPRPFVPWPQRNRTINSRPWVVVSFDCDVTQQAKGHR